jgi:uncharacterized membrane protein
VIWGTDASAEAGFHENHSTIVWSGTVLAALSVLLSIMLLIAVLKQIPALLILAIMIMVSAAFTL